MTPAFCQRCFARCVYIYIYDKDLDWPTYCCKNRWFYKTSYMSYYRVFINIFPFPMLLNLQSEFLQFFCYKVYIYLRTYIFCTISWFLINTRQNKYLHKSPCRKFRTCRYKFANKILLCLYDFAMCFGPSSTLSRFSESRVDRQK